MYTEHVRTKAKIARFGLEYIVWWKNRVYVEKFFLFCTLDLTRKIWE